MGDIAIAEVMFVAVKIVTIYLSPEHPKNQKKIPDKISKTIHF